LGISWDLLPVFVGAGALLIVVHALYKAFWEPAVRHRLDRPRG
jgi:type II secretory pathway component PulM